MFRPTRSSRFALWVAAGLLLLKSAVPMLAAAAAQMRGVSVAEVCTVYGVALPGVSQGTSHGEHAHHAHHHADAPQPEDHGSHSAAAHSGDHCALTALAALGVSAAGAWTAMPVRAATLTAAAPSACRIGRDACAAWAAQLEHGPPFLA